MNIDTIKPCFFVIQIGNIWWNQLPCHTILGSQTTHEYEAMKCVLGSIIRNQIHMNILNYKITYIYICMNVTEWGKHSNGHFLFQGPSQTKKTSWALQHFPAVWPFLKTSSSCFSRHDQCAMTQLVESQNPQLHPSEKSRNESDFFRWFLNIPTFQIWQFREEFHTTSLKNISDPSKSQEDSTKSIKHRWTSDRNSSI